MNLQRFPLTLLAVAAWMGSDRSKGVDRFTVWINGGGLADGFLRVRLFAGDVKGERCFSGIAEAEAVEGLWVEVVKRRLDELADLMRNDPASKIPPRAEGGGD